MPATEHAFRARVNVSAALIAGFQVSINCRIWVSTEVQRKGRPKGPGELEEFLCW
jgi:hypothetical protein